MEWRCGCPIFAPSPRRHRVYSHSSEARNTTLPVNELIYSKPLIWLKLGANYRACLGILRLGKTHGEARLELACRRAISLGTCSYKSLESILRQGWKTCR
ncbi:ISPsy14, transposase [Ectopseudomonas oleovorans]|uniref:ISPsy14, transposase n=1 Tax=Ectopseudomonas oleovorans TaxID=301 RepID=A0A379K4Q2_ECTOL|nr:ISPsy14, transposase [Pseudomonas oleovorans]